jgi:hypothetical protein
VERAARKPTPGKKYFTLQEANSTLPLVRAIVRDITELARELRERHERLARHRPHSVLGKGGGRAASEAHQEELLQAEADFETGRERLDQYKQELDQIGVELKDPFLGLIDFPAWMHGREVYLCWRLGEPAVGHWHELEAGFAGRQKLTVDAC